jgi:DoxX-like family
MTVATAIVSILLAALMAFSAARKLTHQPRFVEPYLRVGVPEDKLDYLAAILLAGAAGLILGIFWAPIGIVAAVAVVCYFVVAIAFHLRADDAKNLPTPGVLLLMGAAVLLLQLATD